MEEKRVALIGIIVEPGADTGKVNEVLSQYRDYVIGRMGIPYRERGISIISVAVDAPADVISTISGKIGQISGVSTKTLYAKV